MPNLGLINATNANREMKFVHDRMPVILEPEQWKEWLDASKPEAGELLQPAKDDALALYPVSTKVNKPKNSQHDCIDPFVESNEIGELFEDR